MVKAKQKCEDTKDKKMKEEEQAQDLQDMADRRQERLRSKPERRHYCARVTLNRHRDRIK